MIPVSSLDAAMLYAETKEMPMHTMGVLLLEPPPDPDISSFEMTRLVFQQRIHLIPMLRRRVVQGPLQIGDPHWVEDPAFDIDNHLLGKSLPSPGGMRELHQLVGEYASECLNRNKPLWEIVLVDGLSDGKLAVVSKFHHAAMDGGRLVALIGHLFDETPELVEVPPPDEDWLPEQVPGIAWLAADSIRNLAGKPKRAVAAISAVARSMAKRSSNEQAPKRETHEAHEGSRLFEAPATPFNGALSENRSVAMVDVSMDDLKAIKESYGTTLNDVVLAACCASLRTWLQEHGGLPNDPLVATVPVALRSDDDAGNHVSIIRVHLPVQLEDPTERLLTIHKETSAKKKEHGRGGGGGVLKHFSDIVTNITVPWLLTHAMTFTSSMHLADRMPPLWNLVISNVPGSPKPLYFAGTKLLRIYPLGPAQQGSGLNITVMSFMDRLCFGAMACSEMVPDLEDIANAFCAEIDTLRAATAD